MENTNKILTIIDMGKCIGCCSCMLSCASGIHNDFSPVKSAIRIRSYGGLQGRFVADICRGCDDPYCSKVCNQGAILPRQGGGIIFSKDLCTGCGVCMEACPVHAIGMDHETAKAIVCIQCGICVKICPHGVLSMEVKNK